MNGFEVSSRSLVWCENEICEERALSGAVAKRFLPQGVRLESAVAPGAYFYTRDHLGSVRELTDSAGHIRARYAYDPFGARLQMTGDMDTDFGFAGMFRSGETGLNLVRYRVYDPLAARWLSRDPLRDAELREGPNLYTYVNNNPVNMTDQLGLCCEQERNLLLFAHKFTAIICKAALTPGSGITQSECGEAAAAENDALANLGMCLKKPCNGNCH